MPDIPCCFAYLPSPCLCCLLFCFSLGGSLHGQARRETCHLPLPASNKQRFSVRTPTCCAACGLPNAACSTDNDCCAPQQCSAGTCSPGTCGASFAQCMNDGDCCDSNCFKRQCVNGVAPSSRNMHLLDTDLLVAEHRRCWQEAWKLTLDTVQRAARRATCRVRTARRRAATTESALFKMSSNPILLARSASVSYTHLTLPTTPYV